MQKLETAVQPLVEQRGESPAHGPASLGEVSSADTVAGTALAASESMHQVMVLLQEIRELALMNDAQRQENSARHSSIGEITW